MKKRTLSKLKSIFGKSKDKRPQRSRSRSRSPSPAQVPQAGPPPSPPVPAHTAPPQPAPPPPAGPLPLRPCAVCGRTFVPESLAKHVKICEKMTVKKRKTFDSSRQRREGTDLEQFLPKNFGLPENSPFLEKSPPNTAKVAPKPKPVSVRAAITKPASDLQRCPHCNRAFGPRAFERHVDWCADKARILPAAPAHPPAHVADAKQRLHARTQYKAPLARGRCSRSRDKSSNSRSASVESSRGVSPPRESGDHWRGRLRASESMSSNDCHDESPHVPVIRNTRTSQNSSGDANVKARQARLAKDLSSTRPDDNYDPFLAASKQMQDLMASDINIPKKIQMSKDHNRTLPNIRKERSSFSYNRFDNTKMMKDTINKNYQKTPTLQRMKSFGSTNNDNSYTFGARCNSFRINRSENKKSSQKLNTTFTKSSKENISTVDKNVFNRNNSLNRSFSSYTTSSYSTPKLRDKIPKISTSLSHSFQRTIIKQPLKLDKITKEIKKDFVNLDSILADDNSSLTDSNYIDPRLINENDNLPINVNTILNNPDIISSMESLQTTENLPAKFESFSTNVVNNNNNIEESSGKESQDSKTNAIIKMSKDIGDLNSVINHTPISPIVDDLSIHYDKIMSSLEQSIASKNSIRDDDSLCEEFDLDEFMTSFDDELHNNKIENKRTCSSTTRIVKQSEGVDSNKSVLDINYSSPKLVHGDSNGTIPFNKSMSLTFSSNNITSDTLFPSSVKRSTSLLDSIQKKNTSKNDTGKSRHKADQLEQDLMQSLRDFDRFYEGESQKKEPMNNHNGTRTAKRESVVKSEKKNKRHEDSNGNYTPNGKSSDSAYSSLNRISPSKLSVCNSKESNGVASLDQIAGSDSGGSNRDNDNRSVSSDEFLAMERSVNMDEPIQQPQEVHKPYVKEVDNRKMNEKRVSSRASSRQSSWPAQGALSSSGSESSLRPAATPAPRLSRFCHECGNKFPVDTAKFCMECGVKRLVV